jgi:hypothetical protein
METGSVLDSIRAVDPDSESGSRREKITHKKKFHVLKCWSPKPWIRIQIWIRIVIEPKMLALDPESMKPDPKHCLQDVNTLFIIR